MQFLGIDEATLMTKNAIWTAKEISQQPEMIRLTQNILLAAKGEIDAFLGSVLNQENIRIILTGAGTSAFVGECLATIISQALKKRCEAISTTDLVSSPGCYFEEDTPTLLVSFGRSGNSPESVAAVDLGNKFVKSIKNLVFTCNPEGELASSPKVTESAFVILLPEKTHDRSFAMTSSFTSMIYAAMACFLGTQTMTERVDKIANSSQAILDKYSFLLRALAAENYERVVYLGSHFFQGLARESALKLLELTDGETIAMYDSPMGFRHGPKTIVNDRTLVVIFISNHPYTRQYDLDLLKELQSDDMARVIAISAQPIDTISSQQHIILQDMEKAHDGDLLVPFMVAPQLLGFYQSLNLGYSPDNPDTTGMVNRVVKGVNIHGAL